MENFTSPHEWQDERPETLVVCCSDGRYHPHIEEFVRARVSERPDLLAIPGGPAGFDPWASSFDHSRVFDESMRLLFSSHGIRAVWLIAHAGCSYYRTKYDGTNEAEREARQLRDLEAARARILAHAPNMAVHILYARAQGGQVRIDEARSEAIQGSEAIPRQDP